MAAMMRSLGARQILHRPDLTVEEGTLAWHPRQGMMASRLNNGDISRVSLGKGDLIFLVSMGFSFF